MFSGDTVGWHLYTDGFSTIPTFKYLGVGCMVSEITSSPWDVYADTYYWTLSQICAAVAKGCTQYMYLNLFLAPQGSTIRSSIRDDTYMAKPLINTTQDLAGFSRTGKLYKLGARWA